MKSLITLLTLLSTLNVFAQPAGTLDESFGNGGKIVTSITSGQDKAYGVAIQSDGKIIVAGQSTSTITGKDFAVVRYNTDGTLDDTFGNNGIVTTDLQLGSDDIAYSVALQSDGKIVLGGYSDDGSNRDASLVRYKTDGIVDSTFGNNGIVITNFENSQQDEIKVVKIHQLTGNIVVGGASVISSSLSKPVVARYLSNGTLDNTFNGNGIRLLWITNLDYQYLFSVEDLVVQSNGRISAVGWRDFPGLDWSSDYWACRINSDGNMDNTFSSDGVIIYNGTFNGHDRGYAMLLNSSNNIILAGGGYVNTLKYDFTMFEVNSNGGSSVWAATVDWGTTADAIAYGLAEDTNGWLVLAGSKGTTTTKSFALARFNANGSLDSNFGTNGKTTTTFGGNSLNESFDVAIQSDNKIVAVGYAGGDFAIARYIGDATPDLDNLQLIAPANQTVNQSFSNLAFNWSDAFGATSYEIEIDISETFNSSQTFTSLSSNYNAINLLPNTQYYWRVRASDGTNLGAYSNPWSFTTNSLDNFTLISPANNATNQVYLSLMLDWTNNLGASSYELQIDTTQNFSTSPQVFSPSNSTHTANLLPSKTYYWRVRATFGTTWGQWTNPWSFTTKADPASSTYEAYFSDLKIYPNPTSDIVKIETNHLLLNKPYKLFDDTGKEIISGLIDNKLTIKLDGLSRGVYFLQIGDYPQQTYKLLKE